MADNYLTTRQAAKILGVSVRTAQQWVDRGQLLGWKTQGGHRRISYESVMRALPLSERAEPNRQPAYVLPILIVEDDHNLLKLYKFHLQQWPFEVRIFTAPNGYEALVLVGEVKPAFLICDLRLPGVNGFQVVRAICDMPRFKDMRLAVISGLPAVEIEAHGGFSERVEIMGKPIDFERLRDIAQALILPSKNGRQS